MDELTKFAAHPFFMWYFGVIGDALVIMGIVTAVTEITIADFTPTLWFLLAIVCYLGLLWTVAIRILVHLESRAKGQ